MSKISKILKLGIIIIPPILLVSSIAYPFGSKNIYSGTVVLHKILSGSTLHAKAFIKGKQLGQLVFPDPQIKIDSELSQMIKVPEKYFQKYTCITTTAKYKTGLLKKEVQNIDNMHFSISVDEQRVDFLPNETRCFDSTKSITYWLGDIEFDGEKSIIDIEKMGTINKEGKKELVSELYLGFDVKMKYQIVVIILYLITVPYCWSWIKRFQEMSDFINANNSKFHKKL